jgi:hypothetical protein
MDTNQLCLPVGVDKDTEEAHIKYGYPLIKLYMNGRVCACCGQPMYTIDCDIEISEECDYCGSPTGR